MSKLPDSEIEQWVLREIGLTTRGAREICVSSHNAVVTLRGTVKSDDQKWAVDRAAQIAKGVVCVINDIKVELFAKSSSNDLKDKSPWRRGARIPSHHPANLQSPSRRNVKSASGQ
jgi:hypothetical protein